MVEAMKATIGAGAMIGIERVGVAGCLVVVVLCVVLWCAGWWAVKECVRRSVNEAAGVSGR